MNPYAPPARSVPQQQAPLFQVQQFPVQQVPAPRFPVRQVSEPYRPQPSQRVPHPALIIAFGVLVAALVITTVLLVRGTSQQGAGEWARAHTAEDSSVGSMDAAHVRSDLSSGATPTVSVGGPSCGAVIVACTPSAIVGDAGP